MLVFDRIAGHAGNGFVEDLIRRRRVCEDWPALGPAALGVQEETIVAREEVHGMAWYDAVLPESIAIMLLAPPMVREAGSARAVMARDESRRRGGG
jgi:hypothetical protein